MLAVVYLALTAKPISLRRLVLLFIFALIAVNAVFAAFQMKHGPHAAVVIAAAITLLAWSMPLVRLAYYAIRLRVLVLGVIQSTSGFVRWTYEFAAMLMAMLLIVAAVHQMHPVTVAMLPRLLVVAGFAALALHLAIHPLESARTFGEHRRHRFTDIGRSRPGSKVRRLG
jgi:hypothetical protein